MLILLVARFTRLRPAPGLRPLGVMNAHSIWKEIHPPGDVIIKIYCKSLFFLEMFMEFLRLCCKPYH